MGAEKNIVKMNSIKRMSLIVIVFLAVFCAQAATETVNGIEWTYSVLDEKVTITEVSSYASGTVTIPSILGGCTVEKIGDNIFFGGGIFRTVPIDWGYILFAGVLALVMLPAEMFRQAIFRR